MLSPKIRQIVIENHGQLVAGRLVASSGKSERLSKLPAKTGDELEFDDVAVHVAEPGALSG